MAMYYVRYNAYRIACGVLRIYPFLDEAYAATVMLEGFFLDLSLYFAAHRYYCSVSCSK